MSIIDYTVTYYYIECDECNKEIDINIENVNDIAHYAKNIKHWTNPSDDIFGEWFCPECKENFND